MKPFAVALFMPITLASWLSACSIPPTSNVVVDPPKTALAEVDDQSAEPVAETTLNTVHGESDSPLAKSQEVASPGDTVPADLDIQDDPATLADQEPVPAEEEVLQVTEILEPPKVWDQLRSNFQLDLASDNSRIKQRRSWYQKHPDYLDRVIERSKPYFHYILSEVESRGLPGELALLPVVESEFDPFAYSHGQAAGMWQFIESTGTAYGLKQNWWYEGRRDPVASTHAALDYLEKLHRQFDGDWLLALASYNSGAGTVRRAQRSNRKAGKPTDFWSLKLPKETRAYVPKLIALAQLFAEPEKHKVVLEQYPYQPYFDIVDIGAQLDLAVAAKMADMPLRELYRLNPGFNRWATDPEGPHRLLVPVAKSVQFSQALAQLPPEQRILWTRYKVQRGDSILSIANRHQIPPNLLIQANSLASTVIKIGEALLVPQSNVQLANYSLSENQRIAARLDHNKQGKHKIIHRVAQGESLWTIAKKYGVNHQALARWNKMAPKDLLVLGRQLVVFTEPANAEYSLQTERLRKIYYQARQGDSYARIAGRFNVSVEQIQHWNDINLAQYLQPGDRLTLYIDVANAP